MILSAIRFAALSLLIPLYLLVALVISLPFRNPDQRRRVLIVWLHLFSPIILGCLGVRRWMNIQGEGTVTEGSLIVSNHVSYLDVLLIASSLPVVFVTSKEVESNPLLGLLAKAAGAVFIERRNKTASGRDMKTIESLLNKNFIVVVFPEGTTSNGSQVLPFRNAFFESAIQRSAPIVPICINYVLMNDRPVRRKEADTLFYYGDMEFGSQLIKLLQIESAWVEMTVLPELNTTVTSCRKSIAIELRKCISMRYSRIADLEPAVETQCPQYV